MLEARHPFTDAWNAGALPSIEEQSNKIDCTSLAALGSCFARNLNRWLIFHSISNESQPWDILYNSYSISAEVRRLFENLQWKDGVIHNSKKQTVTDPWRTWHSSSSIEDLDIFNEGFDILAREKLQQSSSIFLTFGLSEVWTINNLVTNRVPVELVDSGVSTCHMATPTENQEQIEMCIQSIRYHISDAVPVIMTLSPVPLKCTAVGPSIREANNVSKASLLLALKDAVQHDPHSNYFPSYEIVQALTEESPSETVQADGRHVSAKTIDTVVRIFLEKFSVHKLPDPREDFWVPRVNKEGKIDGRLYLYGNEDDIIPA